MAAVVFEKWSDSRRTGADVSPGAEARGLLPAALIEEIRALDRPPIPGDVELARWFDEQFPRSSENAPAHVSAGGRARRRTLRGHVLRRGGMTTVMFLPERSPTG